MRTCVFILGLGVCLYAQTPSAQAPNNAYHKYTDSVPRESHTGARKLWWISVAALSAAHALDASSSWGYPESNGALRTPVGTFGLRGVQLKVAITGISVLAQWVVLCHHPQAAKTFSKVNLVLAGTEAAIAVRNYTIREK